MVVTRSAARMKQNQLVTLSDQNIVAESSRTKEPPAPKENIKKIPAARQCGNVAANLLEEQASNEINEEGSSAPKKNIKKIPAARQCGNVAANLLEAQESNENEKTGTKKKDGKQLDSKLSSTVQSPEAERSKETPAPKKNVKKTPAALQCVDAAANLLAEQSSNEMNEEGPSAPKKNVKKVPAARQCVKVTANLLEEQASNENEKTGTKKKVEKLPSSKMSSTSPEAATKDNANPNMKPSLKKSTKKQKSQKAGKDKIENEAK
ncbi:protein slender lobes isoform X4 [Drosophila simulans]|uniref:protein slender lobes isoform X4 n=1 Tax=Drosophila simulans TaxID=7240 RepID=UPI001D10F27E|nr:protein slender lobes isoform X4 [Drosophila simulans]